ncbi:hypothetical protein [Desulfobulbus oligotrophicus]|jgi:hypothetical protein|uniref:Apea-like HEPN domain-containing protein n=1 Tax=Desulfobulbus oligotrophicus TaxID=1909699 RepID=A0A7T5VE50_9BACT|nr:hypothetical protein [Desulfobulbus oligotrophicus]MDY0390264.1 hypothetical protein [Desulfobulbus oligotrophicus]QQG66239.1 hypothetical protein HP555_10395 [Desulfobulbus oligotrophicus]
MRAVYTIPINEKLEIKLPEKQTISLTPNIDIKLYNDQNTGYLQRILLKISNLEMEAVAPYLKDLVDKSSSRKLEFITHELTVYLASVIFIQTSIEVFDHNKIDLEYPEVFPETPEEEEILARYPPMRSSSVVTEWSVGGSIESEKIKEYFANPVAVNYYAAAKKTDNLFLQYEQFYKVIEYFFDKQQSLQQHPSPFDERVARHAGAFNPEYTEDVIKNIREIRNRCVHPRAKRGPLSPGALDAYETIMDNLPKVEKLAKLLLEHPPNDCPNEEQPAGDL